MENLPTLIVAVNTVLICIIYTVWVILSRKIKKNNKVIFVAIGLVVEILIGIGAAALVNAVVAPEPQTTTQAQTTLDAGADIGNYTEENTQTLPTATTQASTTKLAADESTTKESATVSTTTTVKANEPTTTTTTTTTTTKKPTTYLSFEKIAYPLTDNNADLRVYTSFKADKVILYCKVEGEPYGEFKMESSDGQNWVFHANFYAANTYVLTAVAQGPAGEVSSNTISVTYPF